MSIIKTNIKNIRDNVSYTEDALESFKAKVTEVTDGFISVDDYWKDSLTKSYIDTVKADQTDFSKLLNSIDERLKIISDFCDKLEQVVCGNMDVSSLGTIQYSSFRIEFCLNYLTKIKSKIQDAKGYLSEAVVPSSSSYGSTIKSLLNDVNIEDVDNTKQKMNSLITGIKNLLNISMEEANKNKRVSLDINSMRFYSRTATPFLSKIKGYSEGNVNYSDGASSFDFDSVDIGLGEDEFKDKTKTAENEIGILGGVRGNIPEEEENKNADRTASMADFDFSLDNRSFSSGDRKENSNDKDFVSNDIKKQDDRYGNDSQKVNNRETSGIDVGIPKDTKYSDSKGSDYNTSLGDTRGVETGSYSVKSEETNARVFEDVNSSITSKDYSTAERDVSSSYMQSTSSDANIRADYPASKEDAPANSSLQSTGVSVDQKEYAESNEGSELLSSLQSTGVSVNEGKYEISDSSDSGRALSNIDTTIH